MPEHKTNREKVVFVRVTEKEHEIIKHYCRQYSKDTLTEWARKVLMDKCKEIYDEQKSKPS